mgnify:CR=1 FL=1
MIVDGRVERVFGVLALVDLVEDELDEVFVAVGDRRLVHVISGFFARPGGLAGGTVAVQPGAGGSDPVAQALAGVGEVAMPAQWCGAVLVGVVGAQPVEVEGGEFPEEFGVAVPVGRDDGCGEPVGVAQPVDPPVQFQEFLLQVLGGEQVPVDRVRGYRGGLCKTPDLNLR